MSIRNVLKDPLCHFLAFGVVFFAIASVISPPEEDDARIEVTRSALLDFIQFRSKAFEPQTAAALLDAMTEEARARLIEDYVEEEVLFREAAAMGLEANDYVIKQRLVQKLGFIAEAAAASAPPSEDEVAAHYAANLPLYREQPSVTFTHVFFSKDDPLAAEKAADIAARLNAESAPFEAAVSYGERFPFHTNYVERTYDYVASQFGDEAASQIFSAQGPFAVWRGPVLSSYGAHAVYVTKLQSAREPALEEIRERVAADAAREKAASARDAAIAEAVARYDVVIAEDVAEAR